MCLFLPMVMLSNLWHSEDHAKQAHFFDRQELKYLDWISKFHCTYCAYGVGVVSFAKEVIAATETYFCPIKHQRRKINENHHSWQRIGFEQKADFDFDAKLNKIRIEMTKIVKDQ